MIKVVYLRDFEGYRVNEGAAWPLDKAVHLVAGGICEIADDEPERAMLEAAVKAYRKPELNPLWLLPCVTKRWPGWYK